ncbi:hypothetical protein ACOSQ4_033009 [Xanthoceras sorbifolium]
MWGRRFLFESCWAGTEDCLTLIKSSWTGGEAEDSIQKVLGKLGRYAKDLDMWNQQKSRHLRKQLQKLRKEMTTVYDGEVLAGFWTLFWSAMQVLTALILSFFVWCGGGFGSIGTRWLMMPVLP